MARKHKPLPTHLAVQFDHENNGELTPDTLTKRPTARP